MRWPAILLVFAACGGGSGVDLEVRAPDNVTRVELFIGSHDCYEDNVACEGGVAWLPGQERPPGRTYVMVSSDPQTFEQRVETELEGATFRIHLEADNGLEEPRRIGVVGFDANDAPVAVGVIPYARIPRNSGEEWSVTLSSAAPATADFTVPPGGGPNVRVAVWGRELRQSEAGRRAGGTTAARCVVIQHWKDTYWDGTFIVPETDHDCDGEEMVTECDDRYANANQGPVQVESACVATSLQYEGACMVGVNRCVDGVAQTGEPCELSTVVDLQACVPGMLCEQCSDPFGLSTCATRVIRADNGIGHIDCGFEADTNTNMPCASTGPGRTAIFALPAAFCYSFDVRSVDDPFTPLPEGAPIEVDGMTFLAQPINLADGCAIKIGWLSGTQPESRDSWFVLGIVQNGPQLIVPVHLEFGSGVDCADENVPHETQCTPSQNMPDDTILGCVGRP